MSDGASRYVSRRLPFRTLQRHSKRMLPYIHQNSRKRRRSEDLQLRSVQRADTNHFQVVSAPTGAGKTVLFEQAIVASLTENHNHRIVYLAPTKALCSERAKDWKAKFTDGLGIQWWDFFFSYGSTQILI